MRRIVRFIVGTVFGGLLLAIIAGVAGEFFVELARENGWYANPSQRLDTAIRAFKELITETWLLCVASGFGGLTIGIWFDYFLRRRELQTSTNSSEAESAPSYPIVESISIQDHETPDTGAQPTRDVSLSDAMWRAYMGRWDQRVPATHHKSPERASDFYKLMQKFRQLAFEGKLPIWGRRQHSELYELVPPRFWLNHEFIAGYIGNPSVKDIWVAITHALQVGDVPGSRSIAWNDLMTNRKSVETIWPLDSSTVDASTSEH